MTNLDFMNVKWMSMLVILVLASPSTTLAAASDGAPRSDHAASYNFVLEVDGVTTSGFASVSGLSAETEVIEYRDGSDNIVRKLPGRTTYSNITLKRGYIGDDPLHDWIWSNLDTDGIPERRDGALIIFDRDGNAVVRYDFTGGWPCRWEGPSANASDAGASANAQLTETIVICFDWLEEG